MEAYTKDQVLKISFQKRITEKLSVWEKQLHHLFCVSFSNFLKMYLPKLQKYPFNQINVHRRQAIMQFFFVMTIFILYPHKDIDKGVLAETKIMIWEIKKILNKTYICCILFLPD